MAVPHSTKGAIQLFETLGVLIVFMILLGFAMIFYNIVQQSSLNDAMAKQAERKSLEISEKALLLPELDCSITGTTEFNCIDTLKLESFSTIINKNTAARAEYFTVFESSSIRITQLWPVSALNTTIYDTKPAQWRSANVFTSPILLYDPRTDTRAFGLIEVITYG